MWIDGEGGLHTVALPDPTEIMSSDFRRGLDVLARADPEALRDALGLWEEALLLSDWSGLEKAEHLVGATPPVDLLRGRPCTVRDVAGAVEAVDLRWRLDVVMALDDYLP